MDVIKSDYAGLKQVVEYGDTVVPRTYDVSKN